MKTFLLILTIQMHQQSPPMEKIEQPNMAACKAQAAAVLAQFPDPCNGIKYCSPAFVVKTSCVQGL